MIYAGGTYDLSTTPQYLNNQTFRVVLVPAVYVKNGTSEDLKKLSYEEIIAKYNIDDRKQSVNYRGIRWQLNLASCQKPVLLQQIRWCPLSQWDFLPTFCKLPLGTH